MILTEMNAANALNYIDPADMPEKVITIYLPAIDNYLTNATGKDWGILTDTYTAIDPLAVMIASVILVTWFEDPSQVGKISNNGLLAMIGQLHSKYMVESATL